MSRCRQRSSRDRGHRADEVRRALGEWLQGHPQSIVERPSWLAIAMWSHDYLDFKPTPLEVEVAIAELEKHRSLGAGAAADLLSEDKTRHAKGAA